MENSYHSVASAQAEEHGPGPGLVSFVVVVAVAQWVLERPIYTWGTTAAVETKIEDSEHGICDCKAAFCQNSFHHGR